MSEGYCMQERHCRNFSRHWGHNQDKGGKMLSIPSFPGLMVYKDTHSRVSGHKIRDLFGYRPCCHLNFEECLWRRHNCSRDHYYLSGLWWLQREEAGGRAVVSWPGGGGYLAELARYEKIQLKFAPAWHPDGQGQQREVQQGVSEERREGKQLFRKQKTELTENRKKSPEEEEE